MFNEKSPNGHVCPSSWKDWIQFGDGSTKGWCFGLWNPIPSDQISSQKNNSPGGWILRSKKFEPYPNDMFKAPMGFSFGISHSSSLFFLLSVRHSARCSMYIYMYVYLQFNALDPWILELEYRWGAFQGSAAFWNRCCIFSKKTAGWKLTLETPNSKPGKHHVRVHLCKVLSKFQVRCIFAKPQGPFCLNGITWISRLSAPLYHPHLTIVWIDQIRVVATSLGDLWNAAQRAQLWQAIQCSKFGSLRSLQTVVTPIFQSSSHSRSGQSRLYEYKPTSHRKI